MVTPSPSLRHDHSEAPTPTPLDQVETAARILEEGGVVALPTDTLYGLAASALNEHPVRRIFEIKERDRSEPLPLLLSEPADVTEYAADVPEVAWTLAESFWPGRLTLVLRRANAVPDVVTGGSETVALRVPDHPIPRAVARQLGCPITGTSANRSGMPGLTTADEVRRELGSEIDFVVDAGRSGSSVASTVIDVSGPSPQLLREGAVPRAEIERVCGQRLLVRG